jgi:integrase/recombinase XerD
MMTEWYEKSINLLQLNGKCERTQEAYTRAVRMLIDFYDKTPDSITEEELQAYFLHRKNLDHWSPNTMRIWYCGSHFFFVHVLKRNWHLFNLLRAQTEKRLPAVLSREEIRQILTHVHTSHNPAFLTTVYSCGLRLQEALHREVSDIDSHPMVIQVPRGKGAKDRFVPLPQATLKLLRTHGRAHRHPPPPVSRLRQGWPIGTHHSNPYGQKQRRGARSEKPSGQPVSANARGPSIRFATPMPPLCWRQVLPFA